MKPAPAIVSMDAEASAIFDALDDEMTRRQRDAVGTDQSAALARVWENTAKVALIKAVSANPTAPVIRGEDAQWAREVVEHCVATLLIQAERHLANIYAKLGMSGPAARAAATSYAHIHGLVSSGGS